MFKLKKASRQEKRKLAKNEVKRKPIRQESKFDAQKRKRKLEMIEAGKRKKRKIAETAKNSDGKSAKKIKSDIEKKKKSKKNLKDKIKKKKNVKEWKYQENKQYVVVKYFSFSWDCNVSRDITEENE